MHRRNAKTQEGKVLMFSTTYNHGIRPPPKNRVAFSTVGLQEQRALTGAR